MNENEKLALDNLKSCKAVRFVDYDVTKRIITLDVISENGIKGKYEIVSPSQELINELTKMLFKDEDLKYFWNLSTGENNLLENK